MNETISQASRPSDAPPLPQIRGGAARIAAREDHRCSWYVRLILRLQRRKYGRELEPARLWSLISRALLSLTLLYRSLDRRSSPIEPELRSLLLVRISQINWCAFCVDLNSAVAIERHVGPEKLGALAEYEAPLLFSDREKAALAYAEAVTDSRRRVDDQVFARLRGSFDEDEIVELTALIAFQNLSSKFNAALGVPPQGFCTALTEPRRNE
jgi:AhpD family alkylhydroperoxidase